MCLYKCGVCDVTFDVRGTIRSHVVTKHGMDYKKEYIEQFGDPAVRSPKVFAFHLIHYIYMKYFSGSV